MGYSITVNGATGPISLTFQYENYQQLAELLAGHSPFEEVSASGGVTTSDPHTVFDSQSAAASVADDTSSASGQVILVQTNTLLDFDSDYGSGTIIAGGGMDTYSLGKGDWNVQTGNAPGSLISFGSGNDTATLGGNDTIIASIGSTTIFDVAGGGTIIGTSGSLTYVGGTNHVASTIDGGSGGATIFGNTESNTTYTGSIGALLVAGTGNETLNAAGSTGKNDFFVGTDGAGADSAAGGAGNDYLQSNAGDNTLTGGTGSNVFAFFGQTLQHDVITDFSSVDYLSIAGGSEIATQVVVGGNDLVTLSDGTTINILNFGTVDAVHIIG